MATLAIASCGGGDSVAPEKTTQTPLVLNASSTEFQSNESVVLSTSGGSGDGNVSYIVISGPCAVSGSTLTASAPGSCSIAAEKAGDGTFWAIRSNTIAIAVTSYLTGLSIAPSEANLPNGLQQPFSALGLFADGTSRDMTTQVSWGVSSPSIATFDFTPGLARALAIGSTSVTADLQGIRANAVLHVTSAVLQSLAIEPGESESGPGLPRQFKAKGLYSDSTSVDLTRDASWASSSPSVATVGASDGLTHGVSIGTATISASYASFDAAASLTIRTNAWFAADGLPPTGSGISATALDDGTVLVTGGGVARIYDPATGAWLAAGVPTATRAFHSATRLSNGKVFVAGGDPDGTTETFDPRAGTWTRAAKMRTPRSNHAALLLGGEKVLVVGPGSVDADLYDVTLDQWSVTGTMAEIRSNPSLTLLANGDALVIGGVKHYPGRLIASAERFDPVLGAWTPAGRLLSERYNQHTATVLADGRILIVGGAIISGAGMRDVPMDSVEIFDPGAGTSILTGHLALGRFSHSATLLPSGKVMVIGGLYEDGTGGTSPTSSAELYDPASGAWSTEPAMATPRESHASVLLRNGAVLVVGGTTRVSAELFR